MIIVADPVAVRWVGDQLIAEGYGEVGEPGTYVHPIPGPARDCIHARKPLPPVMLFGRDHIAGFSWQPVVHVERYWPVIVSRTGDVVTLAVDHINGLMVCQGPRRRLDQPALKWMYRLMPAHFDGEDKPAEDILLGAWVD